MKKIGRILGYILIIFALTIFVLRGIMGISFVIGEKNFYPPAGRILDPDKSEISFIVLSDTGSQNWTLERLVDDAQKFHPDFMLHLGDLVVYRNIEHMYWMMDEIDDKLDNVPMYFVPGNHDVKRKKGIDKTAFNRVFGELYYWFSYGRILFIGLDSSAEEIDEEQWQFFEQVMTKIRPNFEKVVLFTHVPPQVPEGKHIHTLKPEHVQKMAEMLKKYPVDVIFAGHVHYYSEQDFQNTKIYTCPPSGQYFGGDVRKFGYLNVRIKEGDIFVEPVYTDRPKKSEWWDILFVDLILTNKVRWIAGIALLIGLCFLLSSQKWWYFLLSKNSKN